MDYRNLLSPQDQLLWDVVEHRAKANRDLVPMLDLARAGPRARSRASPPPPLTVVAGQASTLAGFGYLAPGLANVALTGLPTSSGTPPGCLDTSSLSSDACDGNDCRDQMYQGEGCDEVVSDCGSRTLGADHLSNMARGPGGSAATEISRWPEPAWATEAEEELLYAAWAFLGENLDLVRWAACKTVGPDDDLIDGLIKLITGELSFGRLVTLRMLSAPVGRIGAIEDTLIIWIRRSWEVWQKWMGLWNSSNVDSRRCAVVSLAATLLHECCHLAGYGAFDLNYETNCYPAYLVGNAFIWAAVQRYPEVPDSDCCSHHDDQLYGCGVTWMYPNVDASCDDGEGSSIGVIQGVASWIDPRTWIDFAEAGAGLISSGLNALSDLFQGGFGLVSDLFDTVLTLASWGVELLTDAAIFLQQLIGEGLDAMVKVIKKLLEKLFGGEDGSSGGGCSDICEVCWWLCWNRCEPQRREFSDQEWQRCLEAMLAAGQGGALSGTGGTELETL